MEKLKQPPKDVRVKKYNNGWAVELLYGLMWSNLHAELYNFPDSYYFDTEEEANIVKQTIEKEIGKCKQ